ncbi:synaptotagmin 1e [Helobdella robusta]|uniref:Synaptotagmin 1e n=1 Tax=Helobdella robusta TaxID=6412 RepID=T1G3E0_HELRO|nr:synaptotagmin 1e [Helobdella robusta]ESO04650.1 synaptotagmin 1e [Helobdella robusta]
METPYTWALVSTILIVIVVIFVIFCLKAKFCRKLKFGTEASTLGGKVDVDAVKALGHSYKERVQPELNDLKIDDCVANKKEKDDGGDVKLGRVHYSLDYDYNASEVTITMIECTDLPAMDNNKFSDPYIKFFLKPDTKAYQTKVINKSLNPVFNENFSVKIPYAELTKRTLGILIYDHNLFSKHDQIGKVDLELSSVDFGDVVEKWAHIQKPDSENCGEDSRLGSLYFTLRYVPTAGKLTVVILEAKNLKKMDSIGLSDPYVKISLMMGSKRIKKKKTSVKKKTLNPYYNEEFIFDVTFDQIQKTSLIISVIDYDLIGKSETMGAITVGCNSTGSPLKHWSEMLSNPRRPIAQWHELEMPKDERKK